MPLTQWLPTTLRRHPSRLSPDQLGAWGERRARRFLHRRGLRFLTDNYRTTRGEIDLVMRHRDTVVFVEVKTRRTEEFVPGELLIDPPKQQRMLRAARSFIYQYKLFDQPCRFDAVILIVPDHQPPQIRHVESAFRPTQNWT